MGEHVKEGSRAMDKDGSGWLTKENLAQGLLDLGVQQDPETLFSLLDMDQNNHISYTEFLAGALRTNDYNADRLLEGTFQMFDLDGDGTISARELRMMLSGDGPLVDVLPDGQTIDQIIEAIGNDQGVITFDNMRDYFAQIDGISSSAAPKGAAHKVVTKSDSLKELLTELDASCPSVVPDDVVLRSGSDAKRPGIDTPTVQRWLSDELEVAKAKLGDNSQCREAITSLL